MATTREEDRRMSTKIRRAVLSTGLIVAAALAGCSSSGGNGSPETSGSAGSGGTQSPAQRQIAKTYVQFFNTDTSLKKSVTKLLQHGPVFRSSLIKESNSPNAKNITAKVSDVKIVGKKLAKVTFTIYSGKPTLLPDSHGYAVVEKGRWKVAAQTYCQLLTLEGSAPTACKDKSFTALPR
jgi:hypothetical protein